MSLLKDGNDETRLMNVTKYFHLITDLCMLNRTSASKLRRDVEGKDILDLATMMKGYKVKTATLNLRAEEKEEYQLFHKKFAE